MMAVVAWASRVNGSTRPAWRRSVVGTSLIALLLVGGAGCSDDDPRPGDRAATQPAETTPPAAKAPSKAIAHVGGTSIDAAVYRRSWRRDEATYAQLRGFPERQYYVPPKFSLCVRDRRAAGSSPPTASRAAVRAECRRNRLRGRRQALTTLIERRWVEQEAAKQDLEVPADLIKLLTEFPQTLAREAVDRVDTHVSEAAIAEYYRAHPSHFVLPEFRKLRGITADTRDKARRARQALAQGVGWNAAARRYGNSRLGPTSPQTLSGPRDQLYAELQAPVFDAGVGEIVGPIETAGGWYVIQVLEIQPARRRSFADSRGSIPPVIVQRRRETAAIRYWTTVRLRARGRTVCLTALKVPGCRNASRRGFDPTGGLFQYTLNRPVFPSETTR